MGVLSSMPLGPASRRSLRVLVQDDPEQARAAMDLLRRADLGEQAGLLG